MSDAQTYDAAPDAVPGQASHERGGTARSAPAWQAPADQKFDPRHKSPLLAAVLSIFPGVGHLYIGYYIRGVTFIAAWLMVLLVAVNLNEPAGPMLAFGAMFIWLMNIIDAGRMAALYNHAAAGVDVVQMPEDFKLPKMGGSIVGGAILLTFGAVALSNTAFGYSLDWLEDWWPVFPLALGGYLFARGLMDHMAEREAPSSGRGFDDRGPDIDA